MTTYVSVSFCMLVVWSGAGYPPFVFEFAFLVFGSIKALILNIPYEVVVLQVICLYCVLIFFR